MVHTHALPAVYGLIYHMCSTLQWPASGTANEVAIDAPMSAGHQQLHAYTYTMWLGCHILLVLRMLHSTCVKYEHSGFKSSKRIAAGFQ